MLTLLSPDRWSQVYPLIDTTCQVPDLFIWIDCRQDNLLYNTNNYMYIISGVTWHNYSYLRLVPFVLFSSLFSVVLPLRVADVSAFSFLLWLIGIMCGIHVLQLFIISHTLPELNATYWLDYVHVCINMLNYSF